MKTLRSPTFRGTVVAILAVALLGCVVRDVTRPVDVVGTVAGYAILAAVIAGVAYWVAADTFED